MGQGTSRIQQPDYDNFLVISNPMEKIEFATTQSHMVSFAINQQSHERLKARTLGQSVVNDAKIISETFVQVGAVPSSNATVHVATEEPDDCTFEGMRRRFVNKAKSVERQGMFLFHFSGHGIRAGDQWGLAPSDFDYTERTYITASVLNDWLTESECKAKHVLFTLDCCYAGGIANVLTASISHRSLFVVSACTANESSYVVGTLGHSMFSYFLAEATRKETRDPQRLPLHNILMECRTCCKALSSLLVKYNTPRSVSSCQIDPEIAFVDAGSGCDETDGAVEFARFLYVTKHFDLDVPILPLHPETKKWLDSSIESISLLHQKGLLTGKVLTTAVCSIMLSIASFQLAFQPDTVSHPNTFITAFVSMASFFDLHCPGVEITISHFEHGYGFYTYALEKNSIDGTKIMALRNAILRENKLYTCISEDEDESDGVQNEVRIYILEVKRALVQFPPPPPPPPPPLQLLT